MRKGDEFIFVKDAFSYVAFLFGWVYALLNRLWLFFAVLLLVHLVNYMLLDAGYLDVGMFYAVSVTSMVYAGFSASDWKQQKLVDSGYVVHDVVIANSDTEARLKFYGEYFSTHGDDKSLA